MKKITTLLLFTLSIGFLGAQCCNVVSSNGVKAVSTNGICAVTASGLGGDCGDAKKPAEEVAAKPVVVKGADTDGDGIEDSKDDCPTVYGTINGCPDTDKDGIVDSKDECPTVYGTIEGCPDTDGDGIVDSKDACPKVPGSKKFDGCVDTDGDGIADNKDKCPTEAGLESFDGCPDGDADGVADNEDVCPKIPGLKENKGCPAVDKAEQKVLEEAIKGIKFESGKDIITKASYPILDNVVKVLKAKPAYKLMIEGHTDGQGDDTMNLELSKKRAAAVKKYLVDKGIAATRLDSEGYGETKPKATNDTPAGRAENRRVELSIEF
jgi:OmpA-OmpF porin, OOP family